MVACGEMVFIIMENRSSIEFASNVLIATDLRYSASSAACSGAGISCACGLLFS